MLYHLLVPLARDHILFNVFRYLTFRSLMALITALVISLVVGPWLVRRLRAAQYGGETIREDTPERHRQKKGTPTMGGVLIVGAIVVSTLLWANLRNRYVWVVVLTALGFSLIGVWDDWRKLRRRKGLSARLKFGLQLLLALVLVGVGVLGAGPRRLAARARHSLPQGLAHSPRGGGGSPSPCSWWSAPRMPST